MRITLSLTQQCNLACKYCYAGPAANTVMSLDTARKIIDFAFSMNTDKNYDFSFFGGEPFLKFDLLKAITAYINQQAQEKAKFAQISITTNGTILRQEIIDFVRENQIDLCFSLDGPPHVHDRNRTYKNGKASSGIIITNLRKCLAQLNSIQVNAVYGPDTLPDLPLSVAYLHSLGAAVIHLNPNINVRWHPTDLSNFSPIYQQIGNYYVENYRTGKEIAINLIDNKIILFFKGGYTRQDMCSMAEEEWGFGPAGSIYPCERLIGDDTTSSFYLGNIHTGLDIERQGLIVSQRGNTNQECRQCNLSRYCMNWCGCTNYYLSGSTNQVSAVMCESERAAIAAALQVLTTLNQEGCDLFIQHVMRYLH